MKHLTKQSVVKLSFFFSEKEYSSGNCVFRQGSTVDGFHLIRSGEFEIIQKISIDDVDPKSSAGLNKTEKIEVRVMTFSKDDYFGLYQ